GLEADGSGDHGRMEGAVEPLTPGPRTLPQVRGSYYIRRVRPASTTDPVDAVSPVPEKGVRSRGRPRVRHIWIVSSISHSRKDSHGSHLGTCRPHTDHTHHRGLRTHGQRERILPRRPPHLHLGELHTGAPRS